VTQRIAGRAKLVGFVATQSIRRGSNRSVLDRIASEAFIYNAWADEPWIVDGAAVRISVVCFAAEKQGTMSLDGASISQINPDLTGAELELTKAQRLKKNAGICWQGTIKVGSFDIDALTARAWLAMPLNPNGLSNSSVVRPWLNGSGITDRNPR
jgi:hypothetical protein